MKRKPTNTAASVKARLVQLARERHEDSNYVIIRYVQERLLYRLGQSKHADVFVLKGATLFTIWEGMPHRQTKDLDFLATGDPNLDRLAKIFAAVCRTQVEDDGLVFDADGVSVETIRDDALYDGIRVHVPVALGTARTRLQIDVGFGDTTVPPPERRVYPTLLGMSSPSLPSYAPETVVAEKLEALVKLGMRNTRMKDFFDLHYMSEHFEFDGVALVSAVRATFERRQTSLPEQTPVGLTAEFATDSAKAQQWAAFRKGLGGARDSELSDTIDQLRTFLEPVLEGARGMQHPRRWRDGRWL